MKKYLLAGFSLLISFSSLWAQCSGDVIASVPETNASIVVGNPVTDASGNIYMLTGFKNSVTIGSQNFVQGATAYHGFAVVKYDQNMNFLWANRVLGDEFYTYYPAITLSNSNIVIAVNEKKSIGNVLRVESYTNAASWILNWSKSYDPNGSGGNELYEPGAEILPNAVASDASGNIYLTGDFEGSISFGAFTLSTNSAFSESYLLKLNAGGVEQWAIQSTGSAGHSESFRMSVDPSGNSVVIAGSYIGNSVSMAGVTFPASTDDNGFALSVNTSNGAGNWVLPVSSTADDFAAVYGVDHDASGNLYMTGFATSPKVQNVTYTSVNGRDGFLAKVNPTGGLIWINRIGSPSASDLATAVDIAPDGSVYMKFSSKGAPIYLNEKELPEPGIASMYLVKFDAQGNLIWLSPNESGFYSSTVNPVTGKYLEGQASTQILRMIDLLQRPKPVAKISAPNGTILNPSVTLQAYNNGYTFQWYQNPSTVLSGETSVTYTTGAPGTYSALVTKGGCSVRSVAIRIAGSATLKEDSTALHELYLATRGSSWSRKTNWTTGPVNTWEGVTVSGGRVIFVFLDNNNLDGTLPPSFWNLTALKEFRFWGNPNLIATIPPAVKNLTSLEVLDFGNVKMSGTIPNEITTLSSLREIELYECKHITGQLPANIGNLTLLQAFNVSSNELTGDIPASLGTINSLDGLFLANNNFTGTLPANIWQLPFLMRLHIGGNPNLAAPLPANINTRTQFVELSLYKIKPYNGTFPTGLTSLVNLKVLDLGGHNMSGALPASISNLTQLTDLILWNNKFSGAFPSSIAGISTLKKVNVSGNRFTSFPTFGALDQLFMQNNPIDFESLLANKNSGIVQWVYTPVRRRDEVITQTTIGANITITNPFFNSTGNKYQWVFNGVDIPGASSANLVLSNITMDKLGSYSCRVINSNIPSATINTNFFNVVLSGAPRSFTVDNRPGSVADFKDILQAIYATNDNDTLYISGSSIPYGAVNIAIAVSTPRVIIGPGYFLNQNPNTQFNKESAQLDAPLVYRAAASGSVITGMDINSRLDLNNTFFRDGDTLKNMTITRNRFINGSYAGVLSHINGLNFTANYGGMFAFYGTDDNRSGDYDNAIYKNITIANNVNIDLIPYFDQWPINQTRNVLKNVVVRNNVIDEIHGVSDMLIKNNIIRDKNATGNTESNNIVTEYTTGNVFKNESGTLDVDKDFVLKAGSPAIAAGDDGLDAGAFSGNNPYVLSGMPAVPAIHNLDDLGRLRFGVQAQSNQNNNPKINSIEYVIASNGDVIDRAVINKFEPSASLNFGFRPSLTSVTPGGSYDVFFRVKDENGRKSVLTKQTFTASVTNVSGNIKTSADANVSAGTFYLFEINIEGTGFDTLKTAVTNGNYNLTNVVIGDYLAAASANLSAHPDQLPTYFGNTIFWDKADTLEVDENNNQFAIKLILKPSIPTGTGEIAGVFYEDDGTGRYKKAKPIGGSGVSVSREKGVGSGKPKEVEYDLISYQLTNANGEFSLSNLTEGEYLINLQYPGYKMNESSFVKIFVGSAGDDKKVKVEAEVVEGAIVVTKVAVTDVENDLAYAISVYPNPASTHIFIKGENQNLKRAVITVEDATGKSLRVSSGNIVEGVSINIEDIKPGMYFMKIKDFNNRVVKTSKIVIK